MEKSTKQLTYLYTFIVANMDLLPEKMTILCERNQDNAEKIIASLSVF
jgi:hypothetical protein